MPLPIPKQLNLPYMVAVLFLGRAPHRVPEGPKKLGARASNQHVVLRI